MSNFIWKDKINLIKELVEAHQSNDKVAKIIGVSKRNLKYAMQTYNIKRSNPKTLLTKDITFNEIPCKYSSLGLCHEVTSHSGDDKHRPSIMINGKSQLIYRYIWEQKHGEIPEGLLVCHKCDNGLCINIDHLELGTYQKNNKDMADRNRAAKGINNGSSILNNSQVLEIKELLLKGRSTRYIAKQYNVSRGAIQGIKKGRNWNWLTNLKGKDGN